MLKWSFFISAFLLLWIVVLSLAIEVACMMWQPRIRRNHDEIKEIIAQREQDVTTALIAEENAGQGAPAPPLPADQDPENVKAVQDESVGAMFVAFDEHDRKIYAQYKECMVALLDPEGRHTAVYASPVMEGHLQVDARTLPGRGMDAYVPEGQVKTVTAALQQALQTAGVQSADFDRDNGLAFRVTFYPEKDNAGQGAVLVASVERREKPQEGAVTFPVFEVQWFKFKRNFSNGSFRTNNLGWRDDPVTLPKPADTYRAICMGGSCVAEGATNKHTYPNLMEQFLNGINGLPHVDVVNCGVHALSTAGEKKRLFDYLELQPDLIIDYNGQNEFDVSLFSKWRQEGTTFRDRLRTSRCADLLFDTLLLPSRKKIVCDMQSSSIQNLKDISDYLKRRGVAFAVCSFARPDLAACTRKERDFLSWNVKTFWVDANITFDDYAYLLDLYNAQLKEFCDREGNYYIPVAEELRGGLNYFVDICHMTHEGIKAKAAVVGTHVESIIRQKTAAVP